MAIPRETNKELIVVVEDAGVDVAISPPIIDSTIVVGAVPPPNPNTLLYDSFAGDLLNVKTVSGVTFQIGDASQSEIVVLDQVLVGTNHQGTDGEDNNRIYINANDKTIYIWNDPADTPWENPQVKVFNSPVMPDGTYVGEIAINSSTNSIWTWI